jgi:hypothetical protein
MNKNLTPEQRDRLLRLDSAEQVFSVVAAMLDEARADERQRIATAIEAGYLGPDFGRRYDGHESPDAALSNAYDEGLEHAARVARGDEA